MKDKSDPLPEQISRLDENTQLMVYGMSEHGNKDGKLQMEKTPAGFAEQDPHEKAVNEEVGNTDLGDGTQENKGFPIPEMDEAILEGVVREELAVQNQVLECAEGGEWGISLCSSQILTQGEEMGGSWLDTLSNGDSDQPEIEETDQGDWIQGKSNKKKRKKKTQVVATRQSTRLKYQGGRSIEELAATRKKIHNLETLSIKQPNSFAILNEVDDNVLL
jgi:hypothetical protein